jgi:hypothetical protein
MEFKLNRVLCWFCQLHIHTDLLSTYSFCVICSEIFPRVSQGAEVYKILSEQKIETTLAEEILMTSVTCVSDKVKL